jgi:ornithine decarboxylase
VPTELVKATRTAVPFSIHSLDELDLLAEAGVDLHEVIFRSIDKSVEEIREAALRGVWQFACDSEWQLLKIAAAAPGVAVYVAVDVGGTRSGFCAGAASGASADSALGLMVLAPECGLRPYGLSIAIGSSDPSDELLAIERVGLVMRRLEQFGIRLQMLTVQFRVNARRELPTLSTLDAAVRRLPYRPGLLIAPARHSLADARSRHLAPRVGRD